MKSVQTFSVLALAFAFYTQAHSPLAYAVGEEGTPNALAKCASLLSNDNPAFAIDGTLRADRTNRSVLTQVERLSSFYDVEGFRYLLSFLQTSGNSDRTRNEMILTYAQDNFVLGRMSVPEFQEVLGLLDPQYKGHIEDIKYLVSTFASANAPRLNIHEIIALSRIVDDDITKNSVLIRFAQTNKDSISYNEVLLLTNEYQANTLGNPVNILENFLRQERTSMGPGGAAVRIFMGDILSPEQHANILARIAHFRALPRR